MFDRAFSQPNKLYLASYLGDPDHSCGCPHDDRKTPSA